VFGLATAGETRATGRLAAVLALTEIADQFGYRTLAEDWYAYVVGVAARMTELT
jgi:hypothetical protein